jgi:hypothetical protein
VATIIDPLTALTLGQAVGNILSSLVDAQAAAARTTVDFIDEVGFDGPALSPAPAGTPDPTSPTLRQVAFSYRKRDENGDESDFEVRLPLLGLVDIPLIAIRRATIDLEFQVSTVEDAPAAPPKSPVAKTFQPPTVLRGQVLSGRTSPTDQRAAIKVRVEVEKAEMPPGLLRALDILEVAATESKSEPEG